MKSLKLLLKETLLREIFRDPRRPRKQNSSSFLDRNKSEVFDGSSDSPFAWAILVVDCSTLRILQSCFQTHELTSENIACIEMLHNNKRSPTPLHAIYFLSVVHETEHKVFKTLTDDFGGSMKPSEYSIQNICTAVMNEKNKSAKSKLKTLFNDIFSFSSTSDSEDDEGFKQHQEDADDFLIKKAIKNFRKYTSATCYFSRPYNEAYRAEFEECIGFEKYRTNIKCFQVLEACCFVPVSSNAFTLKMEDAITNIYFSKNEKQRTEFFKLMSEKLGNVWGMFGQYPTMLVRKASTENAELAYKVQMQLEKNIQAFGSVRSSIGQSSSGTLLGSELSSIGGDDFAKLIIMDRGMDLKTPLMHDLTFLPLIYDVLHTEGDFYLGNETGQGQAVDKESDSLVTMAKNGKHSDSLSRRKMREENRLSRPKSKRSKKGHYTEASQADDNCNTKDKKLEEQSQQMVCLTSEEDSKWKKMRYMPITKVLEHFEQEHKRDLKKASDAEKTSNTGVAEAYAEIIDPVKNELENYIKSLENDDPTVSFNANIIIEISSVIKLSMNRLFKMVRDSVAVTNSCFLKQACAHLKQTSKNIELILENYALPEDESKSSMQSHQTLKVADSKKNRRSSTTFKGKMKDESIPLHPKPAHSIERLDSNRGDLLDQNPRKITNLNILRQNCIEDLLRLIDRLDHIGERIKTEDVHQRQMELALKIHRLVSQKRTEYMKNVYVHLAVECLEQLRVRELYEVFPLENELFANFSNTEKRNKSYVNIISSTSTTTILEDKVRGILESKQKSFTRADKLRLVALAALSCGGLDHDIFKKFMLSAGLIDNRHGRESTKYAIESSNIVTDIKKANEEIILGLRKLGGQILKSDPPSQSEIIERAALQKEEARKRNRSKSIIGTGIKMDLMRKSNTLPTMPGTLPRKMSLDPSLMHETIGFSIRKKSTDLLSMMTGMITPSVSPKPERTTLKSAVNESQTEPILSSANAEEPQNSDANIIQNYVPLVAQMANCIIERSNGTNDFDDELINKCFRVLKRRGQSWGNSSVNLTRDRMVSANDPLHPNRNSSEITKIRTINNTLSVPLGNKNKNKSSPDLYDELQPKKTGKSNFADNDPYFQNLKRIREHHQVIMIFIIGGITHSEIKHINDIQKQYPTKTILIGSTHVIKPNSFLQEIQNGVNQLNPLTDYSDITVD